MKQRAKSFLLTFLALLIPASAFAEAPERGGQSCKTLQKRADNTDRIRQLLEASREQLGPMAEEPGRFRMQIQVSEVVPAISLGGKDEGSQTACLITHRFRTGAEYFYPASAIKTVGAVGAVQMARERQKAASPKAFGLDDVLWFRRPEDFEALPAASFRMSRGGTLREIIKNTMVYSSNVAFNKLYDIVGHAGLNERMWQAGLDSVRLQHRMFSKRTVREQKWSPAVYAEIPETSERTPDVMFKRSDEQAGNGDKRVKLRQIRPERRSHVDVPPMPVQGVAVGERHTDFVTGKFYEKPMDFADKNYISVPDLQAMMIGLIRPELGGAKFGDLGEFREVLVDVMAQHPQVEGSQKEKREAERRFMPMFPGVADVVDRGRLRYVNKAGRAYGFHLDNAYIEDEETGRAIFVTAVVYVNENDELNDDEYQYEERSYPFFETLGRAAAEEFLKAED